VTDTSKHEEAIVLAYDFPLLSLMWVMLWFFVLFSIFFAVIWAFIDNFRRRDYGVGSTLFPWNCSCYGALGDPAQLEYRLRGPG
jgi:ABC-type multidrug transport system permease subunit